MLELSGIYCIYCFLRSAGRLDGIAQYPQALCELARLDQQLPFQDLTAVCQMCAFQSLFRDPSIIAFARLLPIAAC